MSQPDKDKSLGEGITDGFSHGQATFDYAEIDIKEVLDTQSKAYCSPIDLAQFNQASAMAADIGAGSGR